MDNLTGFQRDLLYAIAGKNRPHGLEIKAELNEYYNDEVRHGRLYTNLDDVVESGYVEKGKKDQRTNSYTLTERGKRAIDERREWEKQQVETTAEPLKQEP